MKLKTTLMAVLLGSSLLAMAQQGATKIQEPPPGLPPFPDGIVLKRGDPTPEQIEAARKAQEAQTAAVRERWEKEFAPWLHVVPPIPPEPVPFDREKGLKATLDKIRQHKDEVKEKAARHGLPLWLNRKDGGRSYLDFSGDHPIYVGNENLASARTVKADQLWQPSAFNLHGSNVTVGVIEPGSIRTTHNVFTGGGFPTRATNLTFGSGYYDDDLHATHVAGTIGGHFPFPTNIYGFPVPDRTNATGIARGTKLHNFESPAAIEYMGSAAGAQLANLSSSGRSGWTGDFVYFQSGNFIGDYPFWQRCPQMEFQSEA